MSVPESRPIVFDEARMPWRAWAPAEVAARLSSVRTTLGLPPRWAVAGGWAIDLFLGRPTRAHEDVEISALDASSVLGAFSEPDWRWFVPHEDRLWSPASAAFGASHQTWLWSASARAFVLDVFREPSRGALWICRRDATVRRPWVDVVRRTASGTPYLAPEVVLLFKAKACRPKDEADFEAVLSRLPEPDWLRWALSRVHPRHPWLSALPD